MTPEPQTVASRIAEALGLDPSRINGNQGLRIVASSDRVIVEVVYKYQLPAEGIPELITKLRRYQLVPLEDDE